MPVEIINEWIAIENDLGSAQPNRIVLATAGHDGVAHSRIVAIREITDKGILFFTQSGSRKTQEIADNPQGSMTLWLPLQQREVILEGKIEPLTQEENNHYWSKRPRDMQLRFSAYAQTSGQRLESLDEIEAKYQQFLTAFAGKDIPMSDYYCGYRLIPDTIIFYTLHDDAFSDVIKYSREPDGWRLERLSP